MKLFILPLAILAWIAASGGQDPRYQATFEGVVSTSDFIGRVRCITAGVRVAEFVVIETWKGAVPENPIRIDLGPASPTPTVALVGEELVVCARKKGESLRPLRDLVDSTFMLEWRDLPVEFETFLGRGSAFITRDGRSLEGSIVERGRVYTVASFRERLAAMVDRPDPTRSTRNDGLPRRTSGTVTATDSDAELEGWFSLLLTRTIPRGEPRDKERLIYDVLRFCSLGPEPRARYFSRLLEAKEPFVQVAAAIHLGLEHRELGRMALIPRLQLPGDAGVWAAVALIPYGEAGAIERALRVFDEVHSHTIAGAFHCALVARVLVALSNIAAASNQRLPRIDSSYLERPVSWPKSPPTAGIPAGRRFQSLRAWWDANCTTLKIVDPWAEELRARRVD